MKSVSIVASLLLAGAIAKPIVKRQDVVVYDTEDTVVWVTDYVDQNGNLIQEVNDNNDNNNNNDQSNDNSQQQQPNNYQPPQETPSPVEQAPAYTPAPTPVQTPSPVATSQAPQASSGNAYQDLALQTHNDIRARHGLPNLSWDQELADAAMVLSQRCNMVHDTTIGSKPGYGQNLAMRGPNEDIVADIRDGWHNSEMPSYNAYGSEPDMGGLESWGHYTQTAWKGTTSVGCATYCCGSGQSASYYTTCNYWPAGNVIGSFASNVQPASY